MNGKTRREILKMAAGIGAGSLVGLNSVSSASAQEGEGENRIRGKVIYADEHGKIIRKGPNTYVIVGAQSEDDFEFLRQKRDELLNPKSLELNSGVQKEVGTMNHSDSGEDFDTGQYEGHSWIVSSEMSAHAQNGIAKMSGKADASWLGDSSWVDNPISAEITVYSTIRASADEPGNVTISVPPGYDYNDRNLEATLKSETIHTGRSNQLGTTLVHEEGAVTFSGDQGNCFKYVEQDDKARFVYETGETHYYGTYIRADVGHCWW